MNAITYPLTQIIIILLLIIVLVSLWRFSRNQGLATFPFDKIAEAAARQVLGLLPGSEASEKLTPKEGAPVPASLQEALIFYFNELHGSRVLLRILAKQFDGERVRFVPLSEAVQIEIRLKQLDPLPPGALRVLLQLLLGANLISSNNEGYKATNLGKQLQNEIDSRLA